MQLIIWGILGSYLCIIISKRVSLKPYFIRYLDKCPATPDNTRTYIPCVQVHVAYIYTYFDICTFIFRGKFIMLRLNACYDLHKYYDKRKQKRKRTKPP